MTMLIWRIVLYSVGTILALRSLASLMANHQQQFERKLKRSASPKSGSPPKPLQPEASPNGSVAA